MKRRNFVKNTAAGIIAPTLFGKLGVHIQASPLLNPAFPAETDKVLIIIQLEGGNDGLNTIIPFDKWGALNNARPTVLPSQNSILDLYGTDVWKLHPNMTDIRDLYNEGKICALQAVGFPGQSGSHHSSTDHWLNGVVSTAPDNFTGWAGRFLSGEYPNYPDVNNLPDHPPAIEIGDAQSLAFMEQTVSMGILIRDMAMITDWWWDMQNGQVDGVYGSLTDVSKLPAGFNQQYCDALLKLDYLRQNTALIRSYIEPIYNAYDNVSSEVPSTNNSLAAKLSMISKLIAGGLKTKVYLVRHSGYDTHHNQVAAHATLLNELSSAIKSFTDELNTLGVQDRVLGMTISEFGRTIFDNGGGTDHGSSSCMFMFGSKVQGGILGDSPFIPAAYVDESDNSIDMQYDVRSIYNTVLKNWFCVDQTVINDDILFGSFAELPIIANPSCVACPDSLIVGGIVADGVYHADNTVTSDGKVPPGNDVHYKAGQQITLDSGFTVEPGTTFSAEIEPCDTSQVQNLPLKK